MISKEKQLLIDLIKEDDKFAEQVFSILNALQTAKLNGRVVITPQSEDAPIVVISYEQATKDAITQELAKHGMKPSWEKS